MRSAGAAGWTARGNAALQAKAFATARESFRRALALDSRSLEALRGATDAAAGSRTLAEETQWLKAVAANEPDNAAVRVELSHALAALGNTGEAIAAAMEAARIEPARAEPLEQLASIFADAGDAARLTPIADELVRRFPGRDEGRQGCRVVSGRPCHRGRTSLRTAHCNPRHAKDRICSSNVRVARNHECAARHSPPLG
jgi:tetratricopeptide (TPR) repeat protein